jgi:hypothetical protein
MSNDLVMTMDELEGESAELLPTRETLCVSKWHSHGGNSYSYSNYNIQQIDGNTSQTGLLNISLLNGDFNSLL